MINLLKIGISGYVTSSAEMQNVIDYMIREGLNIFRMGFSPPWSTARPYSILKPLVQYYLDHSNNSIIIDINHLYPGSTSWEDFENNIDACIQAALQVCQDFPSQTLLQLYCSTPHLGCQRLKTTLQ